MAHIARQSPYDQVPQARTVLCMAPSSFDFRGSINTLINSSWRPLGLMVTIHPRVFLCLPSSFPQFWTSLLPKAKLRHISNRMHRKLGKQTHLGLDRVTICGEHNLDSLTSTVGLTMGTLFDHCVAGCPSEVVMASQDICFRIILQSDKSIQP